MRPNTPWQEVSRNASNLCDDAFELSELQLKMLRTDFAIFRRRIWTALVLVPISIGILLAGLPVLALALAGTVGELFGLSETMGQWIVGGSFFLVAIVLAALASRTTIRSLKAFGNSQRELEANIRWLRKMVSGQRNSNNYNSDPDFLREPKKEI